MAALIVAALETGCRVGELLSLQWYQVRFDPKGRINRATNSCSVTRERVKSVKTAWENAVLKAHGVKVERVKGTFRLTPECRQRSQPSI